MKCRTMFLRLLISSSLFLSCFNTIDSATTTTTTSAAGAATSFVYSNETDKRALLAIKDQIYTDSSNDVFGSWNDSANFCNWKGVECGRRHQRVTVLSLPSLNLRGSLSPHIGNLTFLEEIDLGNNSFHGVIPQEISHLFRLQHLILLNNSFEGELPTNLSQCSQLQTINLGGNNLGGEVPAELSTLSKLTLLRLSLNSFTGKIPPSFGNLSALRWLFLSTNHLEGNIPFELGRLSNLEFLQLSVNNLSGEVPSPLYNSSSILFFSIAFNKLSGRLPHSLGLTLPKLQMIYVGDNQFSGPIPESLTNASGLVQIDLSQNAFTGPIPLNLGSLQKLELLYFGANPLGIEKANDFSFVTSLTNCTNLRILWLPQSQLKGELPNSISNLSTNLLSLRLDGNYISGSVPPGIGNLVNLELLSLYTNMLTGSIPDSIGRLSKLQGLIIASNKISGKIPFSLGNITLISRLILDDNMLEGSIPVSLGNCTRLQQLVLSRNHLTGLIPEQVIGLSSLSVGLNLAQNYLTGPLPLQVGNMKNVGSLDISQNKLVGELPSTLGNCLLLESLSLAGNSFQGPIPSSFEQLRGIRIMDLSHNNLSGEIPKFLSEFSYITYLNLSFNNFEGEVPNGSVFGNTSAFSILGNEKLCGGIKSLQLPACPEKVSNKKGNHIAHRVIVLVVGVSIFISLSLACFCVVLYRVRRKNGGPSSASNLESQCLRVSYADLLQATDGFSSANLIGEGSFGSVYKGILNCEEKIVAVKVLNLDERGANKSFKAECEALRNIRHRNLVKIITSCSSIDFKGNDFKALVFEFIPNGNLESWLHPRSAEVLESKNLNLAQRLNIAIDVATALDYLHHHCETPVVHCDLKPSNVLLDEDISALLGDFGLARFILAATGKITHTQTSSIGIRGTIGYVAPEYGMGGEVSTEGDMYSYGILLLEMFTGKRPTDSMFTVNLSLHNFVKMALQNQVVQVIDPLLGFEEEGESNSTDQSWKGSIGRIECLASILRIGVSCSAEMPRARMDAREVLEELHVIRNGFAGNERE